MPEQTPERFSYLLQQAQQGQATPAEYRELRKLILSDTTGDAVQQANAFLSAGAPAYIPDTLYWNKALQQILSVDKQAEAAPRRILTARHNRLWVAAAILLILATGTWLWQREIRDGRMTDDSRKGEQAQTILPGGNKATLTLSDGRTITLDSTTHHITDQTGTKITNLATGQLSYKKSDIEKSKIETSYNVLTTPRGGQYQLLLPDGSHVWLNAASSLKYPTAFTGNTREVELTGEGYFEIAQHASQPFTVKAKGINVAVLGTAFNIMSYEDEPATQTTLVEGSVKVSTTPVLSSVIYHPSSVLLRPQQQVIAANGKALLVKSTDAAAATAWKNGLFRFDQSDLPAIMRQISRWYNVEVRYEGVVPERTFWGGIDRNLPLDAVLHALKKNKVNYKIHERTITILAS
jgi:ferric-dicitrate binding protein FerR (iron transport regulator)